MSAVRTILVLIFCLTATGPASARQDLLYTFATCAGRYSALMEHQWLMSDPAADRTEAERAQMISILDSVMTPETAAETLNIRIDAKLALATLLSRAAFNRDTRDSVWAMQRAETLMGACRALMLG